jgi:hypothetical protein
LSQKGWPNFKWQIFENRHEAIFACAAGAQAQPISISRRTNMAFARGYKKAGRAQLSKLI